MNSAIRLDNVPTEVKGDSTRRFLASPSHTGSCNQRVVHVTRQPGGRGLSHSHPGEEVMFTLAGTATLILAGDRLALGPDTVIVVPPHVEHAVEVPGDAPWVAVCSFCDECPLMVCAAD